MLQIAATWPAFDVPAQDLRKALIVGVTQGIGEVVGRTAAVAHGGEVISRAVKQVVTRAQDRLLLRAEQRVIAVDRQSVAEITRRRNLRHGAIVHEHDFKVGMQCWADFVISKKAGGITLVRTLEVIQRREVVAGSSGEKRTVRPDLIG